MIHITRKDGEIVGAEKTVPFIESEYAELSFGGTVVYRGPVKVDATLGEHEMTSRTPITSAAEVLVRVQSESLSTYASGRYT